MNILALDRVLYCILLLKFFKMIRCESFSFLYHMPLFGSYILWLLNAHNAIFVMWLQTCLETIITFDNTCAYFSH